MRHMRFLLVLIAALLGMSSLTMASPCVTDTLQHYLANFGGSNSCTIGAFTFAGFIVQSDGYGIASNGTVPNPWGPTGTNPAIVSDFSQFADIDITPIADLNGTGFKIGDTGDPISASPGGVTDLGFAFAVFSTAGGTFTQVYTVVNGNTAAGGGQDFLSENYCAEPSPDTGNPDAFIPPGTDCGASGTSKSLFNTLNGGSTASVSTITLPSDTEFVDVGKDIKVDGTSGSEGAVSLNYVTDQFGPAVTPEPGTAILWLTGIGLFIVTRKRIAQLLRVNKGTHASSSSH